jgi:hypothetical protein
LTEEAEKQMFTAAETDTDRQAAHNIRLTKYSVSFNQHTPRLFMKVTRHLYDSKWLYRSQLSAAWHQIDIERTKSRKKMHDNQHIMQSTVPWAF